jgi:glycosyltransferase involved in cell wall biosynthesis
VRICQILPNLNVGGQERLAIWLADHFRSLGHEVSIVCLSGKGALIPDCSRRNIEVVIPDTRYRDFFQPGLLIWLRRFFKQRKLDVIHSHAFEANYYSRIAGIGLGCCFIAHEQNIYPNKRWIHFFVDNVLSHKSARIVCVSQAVADFHVQRERLSRAKVAVIWSGTPETRGVAKRSRMEVRRELGVPDSAQVLISTAAFKPQKGHRVLLEAFARMSWRETVLLLAGSGPLESECRALVSSLGIEDRVRFLGIVEDIGDYLHASDMFVLSSLWEGFGLAVVEAALAQLPIVATAVDGVLEIVQDGESAFLTPAGDVSGLARTLETAIDRLSRDPDSVFRMCETASRRARDIFSIERMANQLLELYQEVLAP